MKDHNQKFSLQSFGIQGPGIGHPSGVFSGGPGHCTISLGQSTVVGHFSAKAKTAKARKANRNCMLIS